MEVNEDDLMFDSIDFGDSLITGEDGIEIETLSNEEPKKKKEGEEDQSKDDDLDEQLIDTDTLNSNNQGSDDTAGNTASSSSSSSLSSIITALGEELGIEVKQEEIDKAEDKGQFLRDLLEKEVSKRAASNLTEEEREALEAIRSGVPPKQLAETKVKQASYASLDEDKIKENVSLQEVLVKNSLLTRGFSEEKANKMINDFKALGDEKFLEEALEAKEFMITKEKEHEKTLKENAKKEVEEREKERKESLEKVKTFVLSQNEVIPNFELTTPFKEEIFKAMTTAVAKDDKGNMLNAVQVTRSKNPVDFEFKLNLYHKLGLFEEKPDFSKLIKVAETKVNKGLSKLLGEGNDFIGNGKSKKETDSDDLGLGIFK